MWTSVTGRCEPDTADTKDGCIDIVNYYSRFD